MGCGLKGLPDNVQSQHSLKGPVLSKFIVLSEEFDFHWQDAFGHVRWHMTSPMSNMKLVSSRPCGNDHLVAQQSLKMLGVWIKS